MTSREFREKLLKRAKSADVLIDPGVIERLEAYYRLLARWNSKINLTAFTLAELNDRAVDRLLIEPLAASRFVPELPGSSPAVPPNSSAVTLTHDSARTALSWLDIGSGGGSPAIPIKIVRPAPRLTMVESKARKAAFLREAVRALELPQTAVEHCRIEELVERPDRLGKARLVTMRAVRVDSALLDAMTRLSAPDSRLLLFTSDVLRTGHVGSFTVESRTRLTGSPSSQLVILRRCG